MARPKKNTAPETTQATKTDTVMVALNRTTGITFPMPDGRKVLIEGNAASLRGKEKGVLPVGAFGLTRVNADDWAYIEKTYGPHMEIFKSGLIFAQARKADAVDEADERAELRNGLEPVDVENRSRARWGSNPWLLLSLTRRSSGRPIRASSIRRPGSPS